VKQPESDFNTSLTSNYSQQHVHHHFAAGAKYQLTSS